MSLLPPNATKQERVLEKVSSRISEIPVPIQHLWNPQRCPAEILPWLAHALSVDEWDSTWPEHIQRNVIAESIPTHRIKGTPGAVRKALEALDASIELTEWWQNGGVPHSAELVALARNNLNDDGDTLLTPKLQAQLWRTITATKPRRSKIHFSIGAQLDAKIHLSSAAQANSSAHQQFEAWPDHSFEKTTMHLAASAYPSCVGRVNVACQPDTVLSRQLYLGVSQPSVNQISHVRMICR